MDIMTLALAKKYTKKYVDEYGVGLDIKIKSSLPSVGEKNVLYLIEIKDGQKPNLYDEYLYINNQWEKIGTTEVDLTNYVKNTDYATSDKAGVIKPGNWFVINANGEAQATTASYQSYLNDANNKFIGKGTLENVIIGKDLATKQDIKNYVDSLDGDEVKY